MMQVVEENNGEKVSLDYKYAFLEMACTAFIFLLEFFSFLSLLDIDRAFYCVKGRRILYGGTYMMEKSEWDSQDQNPH